ncbi:hypothetical protein CHS0354_039140 [Potamilus streckersoni]|uniref:Uncharacterized protein n=1 Tax=Potamilus streckersoni TaxID=2493646 RepID=A0AAE0TB04_9BIVA|nr:hypothetical protein CHS0354_039140 [Potamilus streckersoni]
MVSVMKEDDTEKAMLVKSKFYNTIDNLNSMVDETRNSMVDETIDTRNSIVDDSIDIRNSKVDDIHTSSVVKKKWVLADSSYSANMLHIQYYAVNKTV